MKATEISIVLVDDDGQTYVHTYRPPSGALVTAMAAIEAAREIGCSPPTAIGPVLRKVTTVEGEFQGRRKWEDEDTCIVGHPISVGSPVVRMGDLLPDEAKARSVETPHGPTTGTYRYRITVEVVLA
jgi:hypothetical protein